MNEGKRKIGEYTVLCSVNVGEKEVILASNEQSTNGVKFLCGFAERNDLFELCSECMVSDDYKKRWLLVRVAIKYIIQNLLFLYLSDRHCACDK